MTPYRGKIRALAKGVRKPTSRKSGHVELLMRTDFFLAVGRSLDIITQAQVLEPYRRLREDIRRITYGYYFAELVDRFVGEGEENSAIYKLLSDGLAWLCTTRDLMRTARYFEVHLLSRAGYRPQLEKCGRCGCAIGADRALFSSYHGGVVCSRCGEGTGDARPMTGEVIRLLRLFQDDSYQACCSQAVSRTARESMEEIMHTYITYFLERQLKSIEYLRALRGEMRAEQGSGE
jgi:DNA repair protein RecO (recombination protein O)